MRAVVFFFVKLGVQHPLNSVVAGDLLIDSQVDQSASWVVQQQAT